MILRVRHRERHKLDRIGWLRAAVLGANDGILSTASLLVGVASAPQATPSDIMMAPARKAPTMRRSGVGGDAVDRSRNRGVLLEPFFSDNPLPPFPRGGHIE